MFCLPHLDSFHVHNQLPGLSYYRYNIRHVLPTVAEQSLHGAERVHTKTEIAHSAASIAKPRLATPLRCQRVCQQTLQDMELVLRVVTEYERAEGSKELCAVIEKATRELKYRATWKVVTEADPWQLGLWKQVGLLSTISYTATVLANASEVHQQTVHQLTHDFLVASGLACAHVRVWMDGDDGCHLPEHR